MSLPGPLSPAGVPAHRSGRSAFDEVVASVLTALDEHFERETDRIEVVVEEAPLLPLNWTDDVPGSILNPIEGGYRIVLYRIPLASRARSGEQLHDNVWTVLLHRLGEAWGLHPDDLDPR
jgi:predicted Zn-dependent protease with MMP-like domain